MNKDCAWVIDNLENFLYLDRTELDAILEKEGGWCGRDDKFYRLESDIPVPIRLPSKSGNVLTLEEGSELSRDLKRPNMYGIRKSFIYHIHFNDKHLESEVGLNDAYFSFIMNRDGEKREYTLIFDTGFLQPTSQKQINYIVEHLGQLGYTYE